MFKPGCLYYHKFLVLVLIVFLSAGGAAFQAAFAQENQPRPAHSALSDPLAPPAPAPLRVAHDQALWPFSFREGSEYVGFEHELWQELAARLEVEYEMIPMPFNRIIDALEKGEVDVSVAVIPVTGERQQRVSFSVPCYRTGLAALCRQSDSEEVAPSGQPEQGPAPDRKAKKKNPGKFDAFAGKTVAVQRGSAAASFAGENFQKSRLLVCDYQEEMFFSLLAHNADIVFAELTLLEAYLNQTGNPGLVLCSPVYEKHNLAVALPKGSPHLKSINRALQTFRSSGEFGELCRKWFGTAPDLSR
ncbi:MAG: transporter substrate-binding domain-containing protein [Desulfovibrionaceae bacterium]|nr:transporter substrate-binding domain-containing protein [Desulfovibrionaceae bacterium]